MDREQFAAATAQLDEAELRKALWTVYWRGTAAVRERIEEILSPAPAADSHRAAPQVPDPHEVLAAVQEFAELVRSGAYLAGNRAVHSTGGRTGRASARAGQSRTRAARATE